MAAACDPQEIKKIIKGLDSRDEGERNSVPWKLRAAKADAEDELVVSELVRRLCDDHPPVRRSALRTLREVVPRSCDVVLPLLLSRTGTANPQSRLDVLSALEHYGAGGDGRAVKALVARLDDAEAFVRAKALVCLATCAVRNDDQVVMKVLERLEDVEPTVRLAAAEALPSVADGQNHKVLPCLAQLCRNQRPPPHRENLREGACLAIAKWCSPGDPEGINLLGECIHAEHLQASRAALKTLQKISTRGQHLSVELAAQALSHPELEIRNLATEVLAHLQLDSDSSMAGGSLLEGTWSGGRITGRTIHWADDSTSDFEIKGKSVLIATRNVDGVAEKSWARLVSCDRLLWDGKAPWQRLAEELPEALPTLSLAAMSQASQATEPQEDSLSERPLEDAIEKNEELQDPSYAVAAIAAHFRSEDVAVRKSAVRAIPRVAGPCRDLAVESLLPMMQDTSADVRFATVNSLLQVAPKGHPAAILAMKVRLEDQEVSQDCLGGYSVGVSAAKALKKMVTCRQELVQIAGALNFQGPSLRGF